MYHASKFGNGAMVAEELRKLTEAKGHQLNVHHIKESKPRDIPAADLYIFGSPTRFGGPIGNMRRFTKKVALPTGTKYAIFATHSEDVPEKKTGKIHTEEELDRMRNTIRELDGILKAKGLVKIAGKVFTVTADAMKGTLTDGWKEDAGEFVDSILSAI